MPSCASQVLPPARCHAKAAYSTSFPSNAGTLMKPKVFVAQPAVEAALDVLREAAEVTVYPYLDRQITADELAANARRADWLMLVSDNIVTAEIIEGAPGLKGIGTVSTRGLYIDIAAATARRIAVVTSDPAE